MMSAQPADIFLLLLGKPWQGNSCNLLLSEGTTQPFAGTVPAWMFKATPANHGLVTTACCISELFSVGQWNIS